MNFEQLFSDKVDDLIIEEMRKNNNVGTSLGIVKNNSLSFSRNYGARHFKEKIPPNEDTIFQIASVTKSFICMSLLKLQEESKLNISNEINQYLPLEVGMEDYPIRIKHLMSHTSGIPNVGDQFFFRNLESKLGIDFSAPKVPFTSWDDVFRYLKGIDEYITKKPGEAFHYNNLAYGILSYIITQVANKNFEEYLKNNILNPLGMSRSGFYQQIKDLDNRSKLYINKPDSETDEFQEIKDTEISLNRSVDKAAGAMFSTISDLSKYMIMLLNNGKYGGSQIISEESIDQLLSYQFVEEYPYSSFTGNYGNYGKTGYGMGFVLHDDFYGCELIQHSGSFIGASAWFAFIPENNFGAIMLSNSHPSPRIYTQAILMGLLGEDIEDFHKHKLQESHQQLTGKYQSFKNTSEVVIKSISGKLVIETPDGNNVPLIPVDMDQSIDRRLNYYIPTEIGGREPVWFEKYDEAIFLNIERNKWKKGIC